MICVQWVGNNLKVVLIYFKVFSQYFPGLTEKNTKISGYPVYGAQYWSHLSRNNADFCAVRYGEQVNPLATVSEFLFRE